jgi:putative transposase
MSPSPVGATERIRPTPRNARSIIANTFTSLLYHIVFSTRDRVPAITEKVAGRLYEYVGGIVRGEEGSLLEIGGVADHVHLLTRFKSDRSVAEMVRLIKTNSSKWMNEEHRGVGRFSWQAGYGAFSVSESQVPAVQRYLRGQHEHHAKTTFEEELVALLKKHQVDYDPRYLLG